jgi:aminoglycoside phosphotransferase (APT) family kinase protein
MSLEEWHADIEVTEAIVKKVLQEQFPSLLPIKYIQYVGEGWDNKLFLVNENIIFRFPRRKAAVALMEKESILLNHLPHFSDIKIPRLKYQGMPSSTYPYLYQGYEMIPGCSGYQAELNNQDRIQNIVILAKFLKELHSIDANEALKMGVVSQGTGSRSNIAETIQVLKERIDKIILRKVIHINKTCLEDEINVAKKIHLSEEKCFVHGDLDSRHLIFDGKKLTGIIDWGDTDITNRAVDLDVLWTFFPSSCHAQFFEVYGPIDQDTWQYARFLGLYCAFSLILFAIDLKDEGLLLESINAVKRINSDLQINFVE